MPTSEQIPRLPADMRLVGETTIPAFMGTPARPGRRLGNDWAMVDVDDRDHVWRSVILREPTCGELDMDFPEIPEAAHLTPSEVMAGMPDVTDRTSVPLSYLRRLCMYDVICQAPPVEQDDQTTNRIPFGNDIYLVMPDRILGSFPDGGGPLRISVYGSVVTRRGARDRLKPLLTFNGLPTKVDRDPDAILRAFPACRP
jgi:hypothetical protein